MLIVIPSSVIEGTLTNSRHTVRNSDFCKPFATGECRVPYACYAVGDSDTCNTDAILESVIADTLNSSGFVFGWYNYVIIGARAYICDNVTIMAAIFVE